MKSLCTALVASALLCSLPGMSLAWPSQEHFENIAREHVRQDFLRKPGISVVNEITFSTTQFPNLAAHESGDMVSTVEVKGNDGKVRATYSVTMKAYDNGRHDRLQTSLTRFSKEDPKPAPKRSYPFSVSIEKNRNKFLFDSKRISFRNKMRAESPVKWGGGKAQK